MLLVVARIGRHRREPRRVLGALERSRGPSVTDPPVREPRVGTALLQLGESHRHERGLARSMLAPPPDMRRVPALEQDECSGEERERPQQPAAEVTHDRPRLGYWEISASPGANVQ